MCGTKENLSKNAGEEVIRNKQKLQATKLHFLP